VTALRGRARRSCDAPSTKKPHEQEYSAVTVPVVAEGCVVNPADLREIAAIHGFDIEFDFPAGRDDACFVSPPSSAWSARRRQVSDTGISSVSVRGDSPAP